MGGAVEVRWGGIAARGGQRAGRHVKRGISGGIARLKGQREMGTKSMILGTVDDFELDVESWSVGFERHGKSNRQCRLHVAATPPIMAESTEDREIEPGLDAGSKCPLFDDRAPEVADRISRLQVAGGRREGGAVPAATRVDPPPAPLLPQTWSPPA